MGRRPARHQGRLFTFEDLPIFDNRHSEDHLSLKVADLPLSVRALNCLRKLKVRTIRELVALDETTLFATRNFGKKTCFEINSLLRSLGLRLGMYDCLNTGGAESISKPSSGTGGKIITAGSGSPNMNSLRDGLSKEDERYPHLLRKISELGLSRRAMTCLKRVNVIHLGDLAVKTEAELLQFKSLGRKSLAEIKQKLAELSLRLGSRVEDWPPSNLAERKRMFFGGILKIRKSHADALLKATNGQRRFLEDELESIVGVYAKGRNRHILTKLYGWDGAGSKTLESIGLEFGVTRERVRQIKATFERALRGTHVLKYASLPVLRKTVQRIESVMPSEQNEIMSDLVRQGLTKSAFRLDGVAAALGVLRREVPFSIEVYHGQRFVIPGGSDGLIRRVFALASKSISRYGLTNVHDVSARLMEMARLEIDQTALVAILSVHENIEWLDDKKTWFWFTNAPRNRLVNVIRKILAVNDRVDISELRVGIGRFHRLEGVVPPRAILLEVCRRLPWCRVDGRRVAADPPLDWDKELKGTSEWGLCAILKEGEPLRTYEELERECLSLGMNKSSFKAYVFNSPIILRYGPRIYGLIGTEIPPGTIDSMILKTRRSGSRSESGWTKDGEAWLVREITKGGLLYGSLYVPASMRKFISGPYELRSGDSRSFGTLMVKETKIVGLRNYFFRTGVESGDFVGIVFNLTSREVRVYTGNEELLSKFTRETCASI